MQLIELISTPRKPTGPQKEQRIRHHYMDFLSRASPEKYEGNEKPLPLYTFPPKGMAMLPFRLILTKIIPLPLLSLAHLPDTSRARQLNNNRCTKLATQKLLRPQPNPITQAHLKQDGERPPGVTHPPQDVRHLVVQGRPPLPALPQRRLQWGKPAVPQEPQESAVVGGRAASLERRRKLGQKRHLRGKPGQEWGGGGGVC